MCCRKKQNENVIKKADFLTFFFYFDKIAFIFINYLPIHESFQLVPSLLPVAVLVPEHALWFNRGMGPKIQSFISTVFSPLCIGVKGQGTV